MSDRIEVGPASELGEGERTIVEVGGIEIGVFNVDGDYYALLNDCLHQHGPVCEGELTRNVSAEYEDPGKRPTQEYTDENIVICPWHGWAYDVETGNHVGDDSLQSLPTFDVVHDDGTLYIEK